MKLLLNCNWVLILILCIFLEGIYPPFFSQAEVITDGSLGEEVTLGGPDIQITSDLGQIRGQNLFHSFSQFNIPINESATFSGPASVQNIISRVTGGNASYINGILKSTINGADFYLLNPSGIMFGPWAFLDIKGSFHASTADYLTFDNGEIFHADPSKESILSVAKPEAFGFLNDNPAAISLDDSWLWADDGERLSIVAGDINVVGGDWGADIRARGGEIHLIGVGCAGEVNVNAPNLLYAENSQTGTVDISKADIYTDSANSAGTVVIKGGRILLSEASVSSGSFSSSDGADTAVEMEAGSQIKISNSSTVYSYAGGSGNSGDVIIHAQDFNLTDTSSIESLTYSSGDGGDIIINVESLTLKDDAEIETSTTDLGQSGAIRVNCRSASLSDNAAISMLAMGEGISESIVLNASDEVSLENSATIQSSAFETGTGGDIEISGNRVVLADNAAIKSSALADGTCGSVTLEIDEELVLKDVSSIGVSAFGEKNGGDVDINTRTLKMTEKALIKNVSTGPNTGGDIRIQASESILIDSEGYSLGAPRIYSYAGGEANAGQIIVTTPYLQLNNGSSIYSKSAASGDGGRVSIQADRFEINNGSFLFSTSIGTGQGSDISVNVGTLAIDGAESGSNFTGIHEHISGTASSGDITISADEVDIRKGSITTSALTNSTSGNSGNIFIETGRLSLNTGMISSDGSIGSSGDINIHTDIFEAFNSSLIDAATTVSGDSGSININSESFLLDRSIISNGTVGTGNGGEININASQLTVQNESLIESTSWGTGAGGNILIAADDVVIKGQKGGTTTGIATMSQVSGDAGNISIIAESSFSLLDGGSLSADAFDASNAGEISISSPKILLSGNDRLMPSLISSSVLENATGQGGKIRLFNVDSLVMEEGTFISTETLGDSDAGRIEIDAKKISLTGAAILAATHSNGNGGDIEMNAQHVTLSGGGGISCETQGSGNGGKLILNAEKLTIEADAQIASDSFSTGAGGVLEIQTTGDLILDNGLITTEAQKSQGGDIHITARNLNLSNQSEILAKSSGSGNAGNVTIDVLSELTSENSVINTQAVQADGGDIEVDAGGLISLKSAEILASVGGGADTSGGNITLTSRNIVMDGNSQIYANAFEGEGGHINISSTLFLKDPLAVIDASSEIGVDGVVEIHSPFTNVSGSLKPLPSEFLNADNLIKPPCEVRVKQGDYGSFIVKGRDALPMEPGGFQMSLMAEFND